MMAMLVSAKHPREAAPGAFTLLELMVVIAIIAVLASIILAVLSQFRRRTMRAVCGNNLRQYVLADTYYFNDYGILPEPNPFIPSTTRPERLQILADYLGMTIPPGPISTWPRRAEQPKWMNCPIAAQSGYAEGITAGGGVYTGYETSEKAAWRGWL